MITKIVVIKKTQMDGNHYVLGMMKPEYVLTYFFIGGVRVGEATNGFYLKFFLSSYNLILII